MEQARDSLRSLAVDLRGESLASKLARWGKKLLRHALCPWHSSLLTRPIDRMRFLRFGKGATVERPAYITGAAGIAIGAHAQISRFSRISAYLVTPGVVRIDIGARVLIAPWVHLGAAELITIGDDCGIGSFSWITDHDHDISDPTSGIQTHKRIVVAPTILEARVYIGERVSVLRGVRIGEGSVIGANSVVIRDIPPYSIAVGVPARVVKRFDFESKAWVRVTDK